MTVENDFVLIPSFEDFEEMGVKFRQRSDLPKFEFKIGKVKYKATDLHLLNKFAIDAFETILNFIKENPDAKDVTFDVTDLEESDILAVQEIITGLNYTATKNGKNGFKIVSSCFLASGAWLRETNENEFLLTFELCIDNAKAIHDYLNSITTPAKYTEIFRVCAEKSLESIRTSGVLGDRE